MSIMEKLKSKRCKLAVIVSVIVFCLVFGVLGITKYVNASQVKSELALGNKYLEEGKYEEAILAFEKTIKIDSRNVPARLGLGKTYLLMGKEDEARKAFRDAIEVNLKSADVYISIAGIYMDLNQNDEAMLILKEGYKNTGSEKIKSKMDEIQQKIPVERIEAAVNQNDKYELPSKVKIKINSFDRELEVQWEQTSVDTTKTGEYTFNGVTKEYERKVILTLKVISGISQVDDISASIVQGQQYSLSEKVSAKMNDNSIKEVDVLWNPSTVDTKAAGIQIFNGTINGYDKTIKLTLNIKSLESENEKLVVGYWKGTGGYFGETISFYPNNKFVRITMGGSGGSGWRGSYMFDNKDTGTLLSDGYCYHFAKTREQISDAYSGKIKIVDKDSILIYDVFGEWISYTRVGEPPAPGTNNLDPN